MKTVMQVPNIDGEPLLKTKQLAQATGFHPLDLEDAARDGVVPSLRLGDTWYFLLSAFTEAVAAQVRAGLKPRLQNVAADIKNLRAERDEARRELCRWSYFYYEQHIDLNEGPPCEGALKEAERRGWDCFEQSDSVQNLTPEADSADTP